MSDEDDILAAEHALGLADAGARMENDPDFARAVDGWRQTLLPMLDGADRPPPAALWTRIATALPETAAAPAVAGPDAAIAPWRFATFAASAAAALLLGLLIVRPGADPASPVAPPAQLATASEGDAPQMMVAALTPAAGASMVSVTFDGRAGRMTVLPMKMDAGGKTPELWMIAEDGTPRSLGVIPEKDPATMLVADAHRRMLHEGVVLAVSLEPAGGSPTGRPSGPMVMQGRMQAV